MSLEPTPSQQTAAPINGPIFIPPDVLLQLQLLMFNGKLLPIQMNLFNLLFSFLSNGGKSLTEKEIRALQEVPDKINQAIKNLKSEDSHNDLKQKIIDSNNLQKAEKKHSSFFNNLEKTLKNPKDLDLNAKTEHQYKLSEEQSQEKQKDSFNILKNFEKKNFEATKENSFKGSLPGQENAQETIKTEKRTKETTPVKQETILSKNLEKTISNKTDIADKNNSQDKPNKPLENLPKNTAASKVLKTSEKDANQMLQPNNPFSKENFSKYSESQKAQSPEKPFSEGDKTNFLSKEAPEASPKFLNYPNVFSQPLHSLVKIMSHISKKGEQKHKKVSRKDSSSMGGNSRHDGEVLYYNPEEADEASE